MKFKYVGPHDAVDLVGVSTVAHGESVEVSGDAAKSLDAQADWQRVAETKTRKPLQGSKRNGDPLDADGDGVID